MKYRVYWELSCISVLLFTSVPPASAACNPKDFLVPELDKLNYSSSVGIAVIQTLDEGQTQKINKGLASKFAIEGVPIELDWKDARALSQYRKTYLGLTMTEDHNLSVLRVALSSVGAKSYSDCLKALDIAISVPEAALGSQQFPVTVRWTPSYVPSGLWWTLTGKKSLTVGLSGATVVGTANATSLTRSLRPTDTASFSVQRDQNKPFSILAEVDGRQDVLFLPEIRSNNNKVQVRRLTSETVKIQRSNYYGNTYVERQVCVHPQNAEGMLLPSTAHVQTAIVGNKESTNARLKEDQRTAQRVCALFYASCDGSPRCINEVEGFLQVYEAYVN